MVYAKTDWKDHVVDATNGAIIQQGTPVSASNLNKMETGIADAHAQLEGASRQVQTLQHGVSVLNGTQTAPVNIQIEGRTLLSMGNTTLEPLKNYVFTDKKTKLKFANNTYQGPAKFAGENGKPQITRITNFEGKVAESILENPHISKLSNSLSELAVPSGSSFAEINGGGTAYNILSKLDNSIYKGVSILTNGVRAQQLFSFNVLSEIERSIGRIPQKDVPSKVQWLKENINKFTFPWYGYGSSALGNKATICIWLNSKSQWLEGNTHMEESPIRATIGYSSPINVIDDNGYIHFLAYAEASNGLIASTINTAYVELEIELKQDAALHDPCLPLYEVTAEEYVKILVDWNEVEVLNRYPRVQGQQHVQNPVITAEGINLLPPFNEWVVHANAKVLGPYELELTPDGPYQSTFIEIPIVGGQTYYFGGQSSDFKNGRYLYQVLDQYKNAVVPLAYAATGKSVETPANAKYFKVQLDNLTTSGKFNFKEPILTLGSTEKPFVPRNPSYLYTNVKLGAIGTFKDRLFKEGQDWKIKKELEKDVVLDGTWSYSLEGTGTKRYTIPIVNPLLNTNASNFYATDHKGMRLNTSNAYLGEMGTFISGAGFFAVWIPDVLTGFGETYTPNLDETKAFFCNGWQVKTANVITGKPESWKSIVDGKDAPTQTLAYVSINRASDYTPYKLSYPLDKSVSEVITDKVEGDISANGLTQVEVSSGVIIREKVIPVLSTEHAFINRTDYASTMLKNRADKLFGVYKNGILDSGWYPSLDNRANGKVRASILKGYYDPTAEYTVTYLAYDREKLTANAVNVQATFANNVRSALEDIAKRSEDNATNISINAMLLYNVIKRLKAGGL